MIRNYFLVAWRNLLRNKFISFINIGGLAVGISTFMIIAIYLSYELSHDDFVENGESIYSVNLTWVSPYASGRTAKSDNIVKSVMKRYPTINRIGRLQHHPTGNIPSAMVSFYADQNDEKKSFEEFKIYKAEQEFLDMFQLPFIYGERGRALDDIYEVAISRSTALKYFGECSNDILGKTLYIDQDKPMFDKAFTISGIFEDLPDNSHLLFDILISYTTYSTLFPEYYDFRTSNPEFYCYFQLNEGADYKQLEQQLQNTMDSVYASHWKMSIEDYRSPDINVSFNKMSMHPLSTVYRMPKTRGMKEYGNNLHLLVLVCIGLIILVIAWINYINLSLVQVMRRTKETGIRKVIGAKRSSVAGQFLVESLNANLLSIMLSVTIISLALPLLSEFVSKPLSMSIWIDGSPDQVLFILLLFAVFAISALVTGLYPAMVYSNISPSSILKGSLSSHLGVVKSRNGIRNFLIFAQFASVYILIAVTFGFFLQIRHVQNTERGFNGEQVLIIRTPMKDSVDFDKIEYLKNALNAESFVQRISKSSSVPGEIIGWSTWLGMTQQDSIRSAARYISADENFLEVYGINLVAGRNFLPNDQKDHNAVIIAQSMLPYLGHEHPEEILGEELGIGLKRTTDPLAVRRVIGVFDDYHHTSSKSVGRPIAIIQEGGYLTKVENGKRVIHWSFRSYDRSYLSLKVSGSNMRESVEKVEEKWKDVFPGYVFDFYFQDELYNRQYQADLRFGTIFLLFTFLAIGLACLGFLGICIFLINRRTKEIGIRKILGASISTLFGLLIYRFMGLIFIAGLVGIPITWFTLEKLLQEFANRIELSWWLFAVPIALILLIALFTIGFNTMQKVRANPVEALRYE